MTNKQFKLSDWTGSCSVIGIIDTEQQTHLTTVKVVDLLNNLSEENEQLQQERDYWKDKAMTLLMQIRRLTSRMTNEEVKEFSKELEDGGDSV